MEEKITLLKKIAHEFNKKGITWCLGASMLLYFKKIVDEFNDIDLMITNEEVDSVREILLQMGTIQPPNPNAKYKTKTFMEFVVEGIDIDVMAGFSIVKEDEVIDCSLKEEQIVEVMNLDGEKIPLQSVDLWKEYYRLMGRKKKVDLIENVLKKDKLAIIFPGIGYHCDKPLLYYSRKLAKEHGYEEIFSLEYSYTGKNIRGNEKKMQEAFEILYKQAEKQLETIDFSKYKEVLFVSKSVGTIIASAYAQKHKIRCFQILYTPLEETYRFEHSDAIAFLGTSDPWSNTANVETFSKKQNVPIYMYKDADHSLEVGNVTKNIAILQDVMEKTKGYL